MDHPYVGRRWCIRSIHGGIVLSGEIVGAAYVEGQLLFGCRYPSGKVLNHGMGSFDLMPLKEDTYGQEGPDQA